MSCESWHDGPFLFLLLPALLFLPLLPLLFLLLLLSSVLFRIEHLSFQCLLNVGKARPVTRLGAADLRPFASSSGQHNVEVGLAGG